MSLEPAKAGALKGKRALITGGGSGFGRAMVAAFAREGARVALCGRRPGKLEETVRECGGSAWALPADVADPAQVERLMVSVRERWGGLDVLVNNAAILENGDLVGYPLEAWRRTLDVNLTGVFLTTNAAAPLMERGGRIVNITSGLGFFPMRPYNAYCVSKAGLNMLSRGFAQELEGRGILVNTVDPGVARTEMNASATEPAESVVPVVLALAALPADGPTGRFFKKNLEELHAG